MVRHCALPELWAISLGLAALFGAVAPNAQAQLGSGWVPTTFTKRIHLDDENGLQTFTWTAFKQVGSNTPCADYTYTSADDTETFRIFDSRSNRSEIRLQNEYSTGRGQFEGYVTFYPPLENESLMQIFGSTSGATLTMTRGYASNGGHITCTSTGGGVTLGSTTIVSGCYGVEVRVNIIHDQDNYVRWYVNGVLKCEQRDTEVGVMNYWKYGCYGTTSGNVPAIVKWRRVRTFKDGFPPGRTVIPAPAALTVTPGESAATRVDVSGFSGNVTLTADNLPVGVGAAFAPATLTGGAGSSILTLTTASSLATGSFPLAIRATDSVTNLTSTLNLGVVPEGWFDTDVGEPALDGWAGHAGGVFTVRGGGKDIWGGADSFNFAYQRFAGDFTITARVLSVQGTDPWAKAGVMIRESTNANSRYVGLYVTPTASHGVSLQYRSGTGSNAVDVAQINGPAAPYWVRLSRSGNSFTGYHSVDGVTWTTSGTMSLVLSNNLLLGLAVTAHNDAALNTATFANVSWPANFSLATTPSFQTIAVGREAAFQTALTSLNGFGGSVNLIVLGLPAGVVAGFSPSSISGSGVATLNLTVSNSAPVGTFPLTIIGASGGLFRTNSVTLVTTANLIWRSSASAVWDTTTPNWFSETSGLNGVFTKGSDVLFGDGPGLVTNVSIAAGMTVSPNTLSIDASTNQYSLGGAGRITGAVNLVKDGAATFNLNTTNDFTGTVTVRNGVLKAGNGGALGAASGGTVLTNFGTLDVNGWNLTAEPITASGPGAGGAGAIINSGASQTTALRNMILAGDVMFGGDNRWDIRAASISSTNGCSLSTGGRAFKITKVGPNQVSLVAVGVDGALGDIDVVEGTFALQTATSQVGDPTATITVFSNATLNVYRLTSTPLNKVVVMKDGATFFSENDRNVIRGPVELESGWATFDVNNAGSGPPALIFSNTISGSGGLVKTGSAALILAAPNSYSGNTTVTAGTLALAGNGSISESAKISIAAGASLDVSGRSDQRLVLEAGQTLAGNGTLLGNLTTGEEAIVSPGTSIGTLTVSSAVTLLGTTAMELNQAVGTNDNLTAQSIVFGGTLNLTNLGGTMASGNTFKLFSAANYSGAFRLITPVIPGLNLAWDTNTLATDGTLRIAETPTARPRITTFSFNGSTLVLSGQNGVPGWTCQLLTTTNLSLPASEWEVAAADAFDSRGNINLTNLPSPNVPQSFYMLQLR